MARTERQPANVMDKLRWVIPVLISVLVIGYTLLENLFSTPHPIDSDHVIWEAIITGTIGPGPICLSLSWG